MGLFESDLVDRTWSSIGEQFQITRKPRDLDMSSAGPVPFIPMEAVPQGGGFRAEYQRRPARAITSGTYFERGDILVAKITPSFENGKQAWTTDLPAAFGYATTEVIPLHPKSPLRDPRLLFFYLLHPDVRSLVASKMEGTTARQRVPEGALLATPMPDIPDHEQRPIAEALCLVQAAIDVEGKLMLAASHLMRAAMRELFTRGLRGEAQRDTTIGSVPESWCVEPLARVREWLQYGTSARCHAEAVGRPVLRIPNVESAHVNPDPLKYCEFRPSDIENYELAVGDLLFIRTNGVIERLGTCAVYEGAPAGALFASYLIRARLKKDRVEPRFVARFFGSEQGTRMVSDRATPAADGKYNLNTGLIDSLEVPVPPTLDEQREIVTILDAIDRKIDVHKRKKAVLKELLQTLLHRLMTGEIRLKDLDLSVLGSERGEG